MTKRIQRKRTKGYKMPVNAIYVGRPTKWGNPIKLIKDSIFIDTFSKGASRWRYLQKGTIEDVIKLYDLLLNGEYLGDNIHMKYWNIRLRELQVYELKEKDLACFCSLDNFCHADVLLEKINKITKNEK
jgi:hypothetical protein